MTLCKNIIIWSDKKFYGIYISSLKKYLILLTSTIGFADLFHIESLYFNNTECVYNSHK